MAIARRLSTLPEVGYRLTAEEFEKLPEVKPYLELREGIVWQKVAPRLEHGFLEFGLAELINGFGRRRKLAMAIPELHCYFGASFLVPDLAVYRWDRLKRTPAGRIRNVYVGPPDAVVEILSPDQSVRETVDKCRFYLANGIPTVLFIHPEQEWIRVFRAGGADVTPRGDDRIDLDALLPGLDLTVQMVFDTLVA